MNKSMHLGDGAYITLEDSGGLVITANHHDPDFATDRVYVDDIPSLVLFLCRQGFIPGAESPQ